jgi:hypothetical protein
VSSAETFPAAGASPDKASRPFIVLVLVFVTAFFAATSAQIKAHRDSAAATVIAAQASTAGLVAERVNANIALTAGASNGAAELALNGGVGDANAIATAAAKAGKMILCEKPLAMNPKEAEKMVAAIAKAYRAYYAKAGNGSTATDYLMDHSSIIYLMGPDGRFVKHMPYTTDAAKLATELKETLRTSP